MNKAIFYKEWIKTQRVVILLGVLLVALIGYMWLTVSSDIRTYGIIEIWGATVARDYSILPSTVYLYPALCGLLLGALQFTSEIVNKRLKLTLHLPMNQMRIMALHFTYGVAVVLTLSILLFAVSLLILSSYFPREIIFMNIPTIAANIMLALSLYFISAYVVIEPVWRRRVGALLIGAGAAWAFYEKPTPNMCGLMFLLLITSLTIVAAYLSLSRFKDGAQN